MTPQKKNGHPSQMSNRSRNIQRRRRKSTPILHRLFKKSKRLNWQRIAALGLAVFAIFQLVRCSGRNDQADAPKGTTTAEAASLEDETREPYIFQNGDGYPVDMQAVTDAWAAEAGFKKRYSITDKERYELAQVITAEAVGEPIAGKIAVAQCILQACEDDGIRPGEVLKKYSYSNRRPEPTDEALAAVAAVFDFGYVATTEPIKYFYAPDLCESQWHEAQAYVLTINNHKFFKEANE